MDKITKLDKFEKIDKVGVKGDRFDKTVKTEAKTVKGIGGGKVEKSEKLEKVEKLSKLGEKTDKLEKTEPTTARKRRKLFRIKPTKKDKDTNLKEKDKDKDRESSKEPGKELTSKDFVCEGPRELFRDTLKNIPKRDVKDIRKDMKQDVTRTLTAETQKSSPKSLVNSVGKDPRKEIRKDIKKNVVKEGKKIVKDILKSPLKDNAKETSKDRESLKEVHKASSKDSTYKTSSRDSHRDVLTRSPKESRERELVRKEVNKDLIKEPRKDVPKAVMKDSSKDDTIRKESMGPSRSHRSSASKTNASTTTSYLNNLQGAAGNLCVAPCLVNPLANIGTKSSLKSTSNYNTKESRLFGTDLDLDEDIERDEKRTPADPLKSANIQTANGLNFPGRSGQSVVTLPAPPANINPSSHVKRKDNIITPSKVNTMDSARHKTNELQRFFDPIKELCINIPEINEMFNIHQLIGYGAFSTVLLATLKRESKIPFEKRAKFAVKHLSPNNSPKRIKREMQFMTKIGGTNNVVKLHCCSRHNDSVAFVMPYLECDHFKYYFRLMDPAEVQLYMQNLLVALRHVHKFNVIHRDVKPGNFLYNRVQRKFMLVDFGLAEEVIDLSSEDSIFGDRDHEIKKHASRAGTRGFRPPEVLLRYMNQTTAVDIWAAGVIFLSILSKVYPPFKPPNDQWAMKEIIGIFGDKQIIKVAKKLRCPVPATETSKPLDLRKICVHFRNLCKNPAVNKSVDYHTIDYAEKKCKNCRQCIYNCLCETSKSPSADINITLDCYPPSTYDLLQKLLDVSPFDRITAEEALKHPFFKERFARTESNHNNFYMPIRGSLMQILRKN